MISGSTEAESVDALSIAAPGRRRGYRLRRPLSIVPPNSRLHWGLLLLGVAGSAAFTITWLVDGLLRPGYDSVAEPMSALSLGPGGWVQVANFATFGALGCITAFAWRPTLTGGLGAIWYPRIRLLAGLAMIGAAVFSQDPGHGFPRDIPAPATPSLHAELHNAVSYISLILTVTELVLLARRLHAEPAWRGWGPAALFAALAMMGSLAAFGVLMAHQGPGGIFEKLASLIPTLLGIALVIRLLGRHDARLHAEPGQAERW